MELMKHHGGGRQSVSTPIRQARAKGKLKFHFLQANLQHLRAPNRMRKENSRLWVRTCFPWLAAVSSLHAGIRRYLPLPLWWCSKRPAGAGQAPHYCLEQQDLQELPALNHFPDGEGWQLLARSFFFIPIRVFPVLGMTDNCIVVGVRAFGLLGCFS